MQKAHNKSLEASIGTLQMKKQKIQNQQNQLNQQKEEEVVNCFQFKR